MSKTEMNANDFQATCVRDSKMFEASNLSEDKLLWVILDTLVLSFHLVKQPNHLPQSANY